MLETHQERTATSDESAETGLKWFAAYTATHHEKHVLEQLADRRVDSYLPLYKADRHWKKRVPVTIDLPLFPNYIFVRIAQSQRTAVLGTPGVYSIVGSGPKAWELPAWEIDALRAGLREPAEIGPDEPKLRMDWQVAQQLLAIVAESKESKQSLLPALAESLSYARIWAETNTPWLGG